MGSRINLKLSVEYEAGHGAYWIPTTCWEAVCIVARSVIVIPLWYLPHLIDFLIFFWVWPKVVKQRLGNVFQDDFQCSKNLRLYWTDFWSEHELRAAVMERSFLSILHSGVGLQRFQFHFEPCRFTHLVCVSGALIRGCSKVTLLKLFYKENLSVVMTGFASRSKILEQRQASGFYCWWFYLIFAGVFSSTTNPRFGQFILQSTAELFLAITTTSSAIEQRLGEPVRQREIAVIIIAIWTEAQCSFRWNRWLEWVRLQSDENTLHRVFKNTNAVLSAIYSLLNKAIHSANSSYQNEAPAASLLFTFLFISLCIFWVTEAIMCRLANSFHHWFLCIARFLTLCCELESDGRTAKRGQKTRCVENRKEREGGHCSPHSGPKASVCL